MSLSFTSQQNRSNSVILAVARPLVPLSCNIVIRELHQPSVIKTICKWILTPWTSAVWNTKGDTISYPFIATRAIFVSGRRLPPTAGGRVLYVHGASYSGDFFLLGPAGKPFSWKGTFWRPDLLWRLSSRNIEQGESSRLIVAQAWRTRLNTWLWDCSQPSPSSHEFHPHFRNYADEDCDTKCLQVTSAAEV